MGMLERYICITVFKPSRLIHDDVNNGCDNLRVIGNVAINYGVLPCRSIIPKVVKVKALTGEHA